VIILWLPQRFQQKLTVETLKEEERASLLVTVKPWKGKKVIPPIQAQLEVQFTLQWMFEVIFFFCGFLFWILSLFCAVVDAETALYNELWHACAGPLVTVPREGDHVFYFPQGHLEQVWFCFVLAISFFLAFFLEIF
jgi:hypothetical protein